MAKKKIDVSKIKEREINKEEIQKNEKETKIKKWILYRLPIILEIILVLMYIPTNNNLLLIPIAVLFALILYGIDCNQRVCTHCKKWNSTVVLNLESVIRTTKTKKKNLIGKDKVSSKKNIVDKTRIKCLNCGCEYNKETIK